LVETTSKSAPRFAERYAAALYDLAFEQGVLDQVVDEMAGLGRLLKESEGLARLVRDPLADARTARPALDAALAAGGFSQIVRNFVAVAVMNRRLGGLPALVDGFAAYTAGKRGEIIADLATAHALTDVQRAKLHARLAEAGYGKVRLRETLDPALLGGMTLKIGAKLFDTSLKSRLERLTYSLKGAA
jgi:F-type H+-transporting ATPase subunit delta